MTIKEALGQTIKQKRLKKNMSQEEVSGLADISQRYFQEIEAGGKSPSYAVLFSISHVLETTPGALLKPAWDRYQETK